jgi:hypothetical protein
MCTVFSPLPFHLKEAHEGFSLAYLNCQCGFSGHIKENKGYLKASTVCYHYSSPDGRDSCEAANGKAEDTARICWTEG